MIGKRTFRGLTAVLVSAKPIRVLAVFGTYQAMRDQFEVCANQVQILGTGFKVSHTDMIIETPLGSKLIFKHVGGPEDMHRLAGMEVHEFWIDEEHKFRAELTPVLQCRARL